jgi:hypothetical protein
MVAGAEEVRQELHVILVGANKDLRIDDAILLKLSQASQEPIPTNDDKAKTNEIKATGHVQCSGMQRYGVEQIFALELIITMKSKKKSDISCSNLSVF